MPFSPRGSDEPPARQGLQARFDFVELELDGLFAGQTLKQPGQIRGKPLPAKQQQKDVQHASRQATHPTVDGALLMEQRLEAFDECRLGAFDGVLARPEARNFPQVGDAKRPEVIAYRQSLEPPGLSVGPSPH